MRAALAAVPGVQKVSVEFEKNLARVEYDASLEKSAVVEGSVAALTGFGYQSWDTATETRKRP